MSVAWIGVALAVVALVAVAAVATIARLRIRTRTVDADSGVFKRGVVVSGLRVRNEADVRKLNAGSIRAGMATLSNLVVEGASDTFSRMRSLRAIPALRVNGATTMNGNVTIGGPLSVSGNLSVGSFTNTSSAPSTFAAITTGAFRLTANPAAGNILTSDDLGNASWQPAAILPTDSAIHLTGLTNQIITSFGSANPTTINIPEMKLPTVLLVPDPGTVSGMSNFLLADGGATVNGVWEFKGVVTFDVAPVFSSLTPNGIVYGGASGALDSTAALTLGQIVVGTAGAPTTTASPTIASITLSNATDQITLGTTHPVTLSLPVAGFGQTTTLTIPDPGTVSGLSKFTLADGTTLINGAWTFGTTGILLPGITGLTSQQSIFANYSCFNITATWTGAIATTSTITATVIGRNVTLSFLGPQGPGSGAPGSISTSNLPTALQPSTQVQFSIPVALDTTTPVFANGTMTISGNTITIYAGAEGVLFTGSTLLTMGILATSISYTLPVSS